MTKGSLGDIKSLHFTSILNVQHARSHERVAMVSRRIRVLPQFWASDTSEVTKGLLGDIQNLHFTSVLGVRHVRSDERVARAGARICILPQFWASNTSEVTKGSIRDVTNLRFTSVLSVRHVRSDERVAPICEKFAFYLSFERPTRTKWREGCQIHRCDPCAPDRKE